jgi:hypothetical protein
MLRGDSARAPGPQPIVHAGMNQFVMDHQVVALRQRGKQRVVRQEAAAEKQRCLRFEERSRLGFQRLVFGMIAAQQTRSAGT